MFQSVSVDIRRATPLAALRDNVRFSLSVQLRGMISPGSLGKGNIGKGNIGQQPLTIAPALTLRGGGFFDDLEDPTDTALAKSWRGIVNASTTIPYPIMASPLTPLDEYQRLTRLGNEALPAPVAAAPAGAVDADGRPLVGPDGEYGPPDATGRRWKLMQGGDGLHPYPRIPLRYYLNDSLAQHDPYLRWLGRHNLSSQVGVSPWLQPVSPWL
jgi:hypothetical protein